MHLTKQGDQAGNNVLLQLLLCMCDENICPVIDELQELLMIKHTDKLSVAGVCRDNRSSDM